MGFFAQGIISYQKSTFKWVMVVGDLTIRYRQVGLQRLRKLDGNLSAECKCGELHKMFRKAGGGHAL